MRLSGLRGQGKGGLPGTVQGNHRQFPVTAAIPAKAVDIDEIT